MFSVCTWVEVFFSRVSKVRKKSATPPQLRRVRAAAGCDRSLQGHLPADGGRLEVRFEVDVDGETVFDERIVVEPHERLRAEGRLDACAWRHVGGEAGLPLRPGQTVTLRTSLPGTPLTVDDAGELRVGFGGLFLERWEPTPRTRSSRTAPSIVLIVMDTLRADRMSCHGYERDTTPHLDRLAARGTRFENAYATSSWTWPSTASILTGLLPFEHGVIANDSSTLFLGCETLPEVLQRRGYTTGAISCNPLIAPERYFDQGFETFDSAREMRMTDEVIDQALAWIDRNAGTRFFLYLHLVDPHTPHRPLPEHLERMGAVLPRRLGEVPAEQAGLLLDYWAGQLLRAEADATGEALVPPDHEAFFRAQYDASVATGDHYCGLLLDALEHHGLTDETVVAFTADHGEELLDHGLLAHGHSLHRELVRVPLFLAGPGIPAGVVVERTVSNRHLAPTLATIGGGSLGQQGRFLLANESWDDSVFYATEKGAWSGRRGRGARSGQEFLAGDDLSWAPRTRTAPGHGPPVAPPPPGVRSPQGGSRDTRAGRCAGAGRRAGRRDLAREPAPCRGRERGARRRYPASRQS